MSAVTYVDGLATAHPVDGDGPRIERLFAGSGATVVRLTFRAGQRMDDHKAGFPILVSTVSGEIEFGFGDSVVHLIAGSAVHVEAGVGHRLVAQTDAVVTLVVLRAQ